MTGRITEQTRQDYLDAMGIQTWFPRVVLPNALPHREFDAPEPPELQEAPQELSAQEAMLALGLPETHSEPEPVKETPPRPSMVTTPSDAAAKEAPKPDTTEKRKPTPATSKFRLVALAPNDECLVIAEMPHSGLNQFSRFHHRLLNDILRSIHIKPQPEPHMSEFVWPLGNVGLMGHMDQGDTAAADAVCAFLSNQFGLSRRKLVLLFGAAAARFVIDPERTFEDLRGLQTGLHAQQYFVASHGLNELMKLPSLKAETWKDLQALLSATPTNNDH